MNEVRLKNLVTHIVEKNDGTLREFVALENLHSGSGSLNSGELEFKAAEDSLQHKKGDVLFSKLRPYLAKSHLAKVARTGTSELMVLRAGRDLDSRYLFYTSLSRPWIDWAVATSYGSKMPRTSWEGMADYRLHVPPLEEQRRIADFLDAETSRIDELVALTRVQLTVLAERRIVQVRQMTTRGAARVASPTGVPWMPRMASGWTLRKIGRTFKTGSGTTPRLDDERYCGDDVPWINTSDLRDGLVDVVKNSLSNEALRDHSALRVYEPGVLVVAMYGATVGRVGITGTSCCVNQACCVLYSPASLTTEYAYFWLLGFRGDILKMATGGGQPNISQDTVRSLRIPAPDVSTQREIVRFLEREEGLYRSKTELLNKRLELLAERKQALITAAVTGQIDVTSAGRATADLRA